MGYKKRQCRNAAIWTLFYLAYILLLVCLFKEEIRKRRTADIAVKKVNVNEHVIHGITARVDQETDRLALQNITGKLPEWQYRGLMDALKVKDTKLSAFKQSLTQEEYDTLMGLLRKLKQVSEENKLTYMLCSGSLLGAYRHAGIVPWDDDIDVWMDYRQFEMVRAIFNNTAGVILHQSAYTKTLWKMSNTSRRVDLHRPNQDPRFPYIDIFFYTGNSTHIFDTEITLRDKFTVLIDDVFPLRKAMFEDEEFDVPNKMTRVVEKIYGTSDICTSQDFTHLFYIDIETVVSVPCEQLYDYYPFIVRSFIDKKLVETLKIANKTIRRTVIDLPDLLK